MRGRRAARTATLGLGLACTAVLSFSADTSAATVGGGTLAGTITESAAVPAPPLCAQLTHTLSGMVTGFSAVTTGGIALFGPAGLTVSESGATAPAWENSAGTFQDNRCTMPTLAQAAGNTTQMRIASVCASSETNGGAPVCPATNGGAFSCQWTNGNPAGSGDDWAVRVVNDVTVSLSNGTCTKPVLMGPPQTFVGATMKTTFPVVPDATFTTATVAGTINVTTS